MTVRRHRYDQVIVGAGVAGCVLAGRLAASGRDVLLLDAGRAVHGATGRGASFFDALADPERSFADVIVSATRGAAPIPYRLGRGVGGGAAVNAMLATPPLPSDFDRWSSDHDLPGWAWPVVRGTIDDHLLPLHQPDPAEWGSVDRALVDAATALGHPRCPEQRGDVLGVGPAWLTRQHGRRVTPGDVYLPIGGSNLTTRGDTTVRRVVVTGGRAIGVLTDDGELIEAGEVILSSGAFATTALLQRSLLASRTRHQVRDHPSIRLGLRLREPNDRNGLVAATLLRWSSSDGEADLQLLPLNHLGPTADPHMAGLLVALLHAQSTGSIASAADGGRVDVQLDLLADETDRRRMREAARHLAAIARSEPFAAIAKAVFIDDRGTPLEALPLDDDDALDRWMLASVGDTFHAGSTCAMGGPDDLSSVVDDMGLVHGVQSLRVCDASIFPDLPTANPYLPLVMVAEQVSRRMVAAG